MFFFCFFFCFFVFVFLVFFILLEEKLICSVDFIYIKLLPEIT